MSAEQIRTTKQIRGLELLKVRMKSLLLFPLRGLLRAGRRNGLPVTEKEREAEAQDIASVNEYATIRRSSGGLKR